MFSNVYSAENEKKGDGGNYNQSVSLGLIICVTPFEQKKFAF